jgi:hypothetical protein
MRSAGARRRHPAENNPTIAPMSPRHPVLILLAASTLAAAQSNPPADGNAAALQAWQAATGDGAVPQVVQQPDGSTRLEWKGNAVVDLYRNDITAPVGVPGAPPLATPLKTGDFAKGLFTTDLRLISPEGVVSYVQGSLLASNDRAVLTRYSSQITTLQAGRTAPGQQLLAGDVAANFSTLGTMMGIRGLSIAQQLDTWQVSGQAGVIAESWEALANRKPVDGSPARSRYLRDVYGAKVEKAFMPEFKVFGTAQGFRDQQDSLPAAQQALQPADGHSGSLGFSWQRDTATLIAEVAGSTYEERHQDARDGTAKVIDGTYRYEAWNLRAGWHDIDPNYVSLSQVVPPGVKETYAGADWTVSPTLTLGMDLRDATLRTPSIVFKPPVDPAAPIDPNALPVAPPAAPGTTTKSRSVTSRAMLNFGPEMPGWNANLQDMEMDGTDAVGNANRSSNWSAALAYTSPDWMGNATVGGGRLRNNGFPSSDSRTKMAQLMIGRTYTDPSPAGTPLWSFTWNVLAQRQVQELTTTGGETRLRNFQLTLGGQRIDWGQLNLVLGEAVMTQPTGGPDLTTTTAQLEAIRPLSGQNFVKLYLRDIHRNKGDPNLRTDELTGGVQVSITW